jgi:Tfp pilus assembly protein PilV
MKTTNSAQRGAWSVERRDTARHLFALGLVTKNHLRQGRLRFAPALATCHSESASGGFSLVEVVIAIGIFAFVIVGIVGLFPAALRIRSESALDTRATMIAQQMMSAIDSSSSLSSVVIPVGTTRGNPATRTVNLLDTNTPTVIGFQSRSTLPGYYYDTSPQSTWINLGGSDAKMVQTAASHNISSLVRVSASTNNLTNLAQVTIQVRSPASLWISNSRVVTFTTYRPFP